MLIIIEKDQKIRKKLCDLVERERIIGVDSITGTAERICKFHDRIKLIISRIHFLPDIYNKQLINKICSRLSTKAPPVIGYYTKDDTAIKSELEKLGAEFKLVEYNEQDPEFPEKFIKLMNKVYPDLVYDMSRAKQVWLKKTEEQGEEFVDPSQWLKEEGFVEIVDEIESRAKDKTADEVIPFIEEILKKDFDRKERVTGEKEKSEKDYKALYLKMKEKYERLSKYVEELVGFVKGL